MGWPAKQSRSPKLHGYWIKRYNIDGDYRVAEIPPEDFPAFLADFAKNGYVGGNVTMPHKDVALAKSEPDERARNVGAANTLWIDNGRLRSTNTDVEGFIGALDANAPDWDRMTDTAVVLGAGGASRAVVFGLIERGIKTIHVVNRTAAKADGLVAQGAERADRPVDAVRSGGQHLRRHEAGEVGLVVAGTAGDVEALAARQLGEDPP